MGIVFAVLAIAGWGLGDFLIQRSARKLGDWEALFFIVFFATIVLLPFVFNTLSALTAYDWAILSLTSVVILAASLFDFEALRVGKMSIVEPIYAMEVPITVALATFILGEAISGFQLSLILALLLGVFLISNKHLSRIRLKSIERGVLSAVIATIGMGFSNFLFGFGSRATGPLMITWFTSMFMATATLVYLVRSRQAWKLAVHWRRNKRLILAVGMTDTAAWVGYSAATLYIPIGIATGLTESYIALAAVLGLTLNKEKLRIHQAIGLVLAVCCATVLAFTVEGL